MHQQKHYGVYFKRRYGLVPRILIYFAQKQPPGVFCKKDVLRNFAKPTGKHLCQRLFFNKVAGLGTVFFLWILQNFYEHLFYRAPPDFAYIFLFIVSILYQFDGKCGKVYISSNPFTVAKMHSLTLFQKTFTFVFCQN